MAIGDRRSAIGGAERTESPPLHPQRREPRFRSRFDDDINKMGGCIGIGCISDTEDQPLIIGSHLGNDAIVTVGRITNITEIVWRAFEKRTTDLSEDTQEGFDPTEVSAAIIVTDECIVERIRRDQS